VPAPGKLGRQSRFVVLGAGVSGLSVALALLLRGHAVTLLERGEAGGESSWAGGGILSPLLPWHYPEAVNALALRSMQAYPDWVGQIEARSGKAAEYWRCGMRIHGGAPEAALAWCRTHGLTAEDQGERGLLLPEIAQIRNPRLVTAMREAVLALGGVLQSGCTVLAAHADDRRIEGVETSLGPFQADHFVLATGAWAGQPIEGLAPAPNIRPVRGQMLLFRLAAGALDHILYRDGLYVIPRRDGHVLVGSTLEDAGFDKSTDAATAGRLQAEASALLPALVGMQPIRHWAGLRPGSPDNIPVIGAHPDFDNVFVNAGHYRYGVTMAPASAELLVDLIEGRAPALDPAPYRWEAAAARHWKDTP